MKELLSTIVRPLVNDPDAVSIKQVDRGHTIVLELHVAPTDMGKIIGKQGRIAKALRTVVKAAATKENKNVIVEIIQ